MLAQADVDGKTNEITQFAPLLEPLDLAGCVVTADAMHTQGGHAGFLVQEKKAHYILVVKKNRPTLYAQVKNLPWQHIPAAHRQLGREEHRNLKATAVAARLAFPHAAHAIRVTRRIRSLNGGKWRTATIYGITSLTACGVPELVQSPGVCLVSATQILDHIPSSPAASCCISPSHRRPGPGQARR